MRHAFLPTPPHHFVCLTRCPPLPRSMDAVPQDVDPSRCAVLFPSDTALDVEQLEPDSIDRLFIIDSRWWVSVARCGDSYVWLPGGSARCTRSPHLTLAMRFWLRGRGFVVTEITSSRDWNWDSLHATTLPRLCRRAAQGGGAICQCDKRMHGLLGKPPCFSATCCWDPRFRMRNLRTGRDPRHQQLRGCCEAL